MPRKLKRYYGRGDLHFITFSCYRRCALLGTCVCPGTPGSADQVWVFSRGLRGHARARSLAGERAEDRHPLHHRAQLKAAGIQAAARQPSERVSWTKTICLPRILAAHRSAAVLAEAIPRLQRLQRREEARETRIHPLQPVTRGLVKDPKDWVWSSYASYSGKGLPLIPIDFVD